MTTIKEHGVGTISANSPTPTDMYPLLPGINRVDVVYPAGTAATITPKTTSDPSNAANTSPVYMNGVSHQFTATNTFEIVGPGWLGFVVAGFSGDPIEIRVTR